MSTTHRVIACVDQSAFAESVTDHAAWAAMRLDAPLELLHVIDRHPETATSSDRPMRINPNPATSSPKTRTSSSPTNSPKGRQSSA